jgi:hypothetical protein
MALRGEHPHAGRLGQICSVGAILRLGSGNKLRGLRVACLLPIRRPMKTAHDETQIIVNTAVDYSRSLTKMIDDGHYDEVHRDITPRNFRLSARGFRQIELTLVQFKYPVAPLEAVMLMKERGYRPATIEEILALGSQHPELQRSIPIVGLGSARVVENRRYVLCLGGSQSTRELGLAVIYRRWSIYYRFAFVRE